MMPNPLPYALGLLLAVLVPSCLAHRVDVTYFDGATHAFSWSEQREIQAIADRTAAEVQRHLPALPASLTLRVGHGRNVIPETGETSSFSRPNIVYWTVDATRPEGVSAIADAHLRASLFYQFYSLVRAAAIPPGYSLRDTVVSSGLATAFERDLAGSAPPWGAYPPEASAWLAQVLALPPDAEPGALPRGGPRWMSIKVGTYLADRAVAASGRSVAGLISAPADEIIRLATGSPAPVRRP